MEDYNQPEQAPRVITERADKSLMPLSIQSQNKLVKYSFKYSGLNSYSKHILYLIAG